MMGLRISLVFVLTMVQFKVLQTAPVKGIDVCGNKIADLVFALDTSGSIWEEDFLQQLKFVDSVVRQLDIGVEKVRIGLITFGSKVYHQFHLQDYHQKTKLTNAILNVQYSGGGTNTGSAIAHARNIMFKSSNGGRDYVDKILIVITDGFSRNTTQAALEASICRSLGIKIFSVGVGFGVDDFELKAIANRPSDNDEKFNFRVDAFSALESMSSALTTSLCEVMHFDQRQQNDEQAVVEDVDKNMRKHCGGKPADIYFVIDASSSIMEHNFRKMLNFVNDVIDLFDIGPERTRIGVVIFSDGINPVIHLNNDYSRSELKRRIDEAPYLYGGTKTGSTIEYIRKRGFSTEHARRDVAHITIILTDGQSEDTAKTINEARLSHEQGIYIFAVGIGDQVDRQELRSIASTPADDFMFEIDDFDALASLKSILAIETCNAHDLQQDEPRCNMQNLDVTYIFDSFSMDQKKINIINDFIADMIQLSNTGKDDNKINSAVLIHPCKNRKAFLPAPADDADGFLSSVSNSQSKGLSSLLRKLRHHRYRSQYGRRHKVHNIAVIFVDGYLFDYRDVELEAKRVKFQKTTEILVVAIGGSDCGNKLKNVCSEPSSEHLLTVPNFSSLHTLKDRLFAKFCRDTTFSVG